MSQPRKTKNVPQKANFRPSVLLSLSSLSIQPASSYYCDYININEHSNGDLAYSFTDMLLHITFCSPKYPSPIESSESNVLLAAITNYKHFYSKHWKWTPIISSAIRHLTLSLPTDNSNSKHFTNCFELNVCLPFTQAAISSALAASTTSNSTSSTTSG